MAIKINFDSNHAIETPTLILATRSGRKIGKLPAYEVVFKDTFASYSEMQFKILKSKCSFWDDVDNFKLFYCREFNQWYEMYVEIIDGDGTVKSIEGVSLGEAELSQINLHDIQINTEDDISRDDYQPTVLYDDTTPNASLLDRILEKAPHYSVKHVDSTIAGIQRVFEFDDESIYDAFKDIAEEIGCLFDVGCRTDANSRITREIRVYDLCSYCNDCGSRFESYGNCTECGSSNVVPGYGKNTQIFVSTDNLADEIEYSTDTDSVKNCFQLVAGDDLMTATVINCNPNGSQYLWNITDEMKRDMSSALVSKLSQYDSQYAYYSNDYVITPASANRTAYNNLVTKYVSYKSDLHEIPATIKGYPSLMSYYYDTIDFNLFLTSVLMPDASLPDTTASEQALLLNAASLSPVAVSNLSSCSQSTATSSVKAMAQTIIDPRYQVVANATSYSSGRWVGTFTVTNYSDDEDTATTSSITLTITDDYQTYLQQRINKALAKTVDDATDIVSIFSLDTSDFKAEMKKYCLNRLQSFYDACQAAVDILIEQGVADKQSWASKTPDMYTEVYLPYYNKLTYISDEMKLRESEIAVIIGKYDINGDLLADGMQNVLEKSSNTINKALDFKAFLGNDLWKEFAAYRREDTYSNSNYISSGLDNAEIFKMAQEFIGVAKRELIKSSSQKHSIVSTLKNLLAMPEFASIIDYFEVGNWLRASVDGSVYRLRLLDYKIEYDNPDNIAVTFSDVTNDGQPVNNINDLLKNMSSLSSSYGAVAKQANNGSESKSILDNWVNHGLSLTNMRIVNSAENQNVSWDERGILLREYLPETDAYDVRQLKIINRGLYATDDAWLTSKAAIGNFTFWNPSTKQVEESYGVIADTLVGNFILGENVGIYNQGSTITLNKDGLNITNGTTTVKVNPNDSTGIVSITTGGTKRLWTDSDGALHIRGDGSALDITANSSITGLSSRIDQTPSNITLSVSNGSTSSTITLSGTNVTTQSKTISFSGLVSFTDLSTSGSTTINGSNITTGTISAERVRLYDKMTVYNGSTGSTAGGYIGYMEGYSSSTGKTYGIALMSPDRSDGTYNYVIATDSGVRLTNVYQGNVYTSFNISGKAGEFQRDGVGLISFLSTSTSTDGAIYLYGTNTGDLSVTRKIRISAAVSNTDDSGRIVVYAASGSSGVNAYSVRSTDNSDNVVATMGTNSAGVGYITARNASGSTRVAIASNTTDGGVVRLYNAANTASFAITYAWLQKVNALLS